MNKNNITILKKEKIECSICGEIHDVELCEEIVEKKVKNEYVKFKEKYYRCNKFENENTHYADNMWNESLLNGIDAYRKMKDLLTSEDIKK